MTNRMKNLFCRGSKSAERGEAGAASKGVNVIVVRAIITLAALPSPAFADPSSIADAGAEAAGKAGTFFAGGLFAVWLLLFYFIFKNFSGQKKWVQPVAASALLAMISSAVGSPMFYRVALVIVGGVLVRSILVRRKRLAASSSPHSP